MIVIDGKEYRNLEEQVLKNMEDIKTLQESVVDITTEDNTFTGINNFEGNLYKLTPGGAPQFAANNVMTAISFYDENDDQTGTVGVTSSGVKIKADNSVIEVSDIGIDISAPGSGVGIHNVNTPEDDYDVANKEYVDGTITDTVAGYLPLSGGAMTGDLSITNYKKLQFASGSYFQNEASQRTALYGALKMANNSIDMNSHKITNVTDPASAQDAATKNYVDDGLSAKLDTSGGTMTGTLNMGDNIIQLGTHNIQNVTANGYLDISGTVRFLTSTVFGGNLNVTNKKITNLATPVNGTDAANKDYVDSVATQSGSTYTLTITSNLTGATIRRAWKVGKVITFCGVFNDDLNLGANTITLQSGDLIATGTISCGDEIMDIAASGEFEAESSSQTGSTVNGRNFTGTIYLQ